MFLISDSVQWAIQIKNVNTNTEGGGRGNRSRQPKLFDYKINLSHTLAI